MRIHGYPDLGTLENNTTTPTVPPYLKELLQNNSIIYKRKMYVNSSTSL
jgi:hypothetical protein